MKYLWIENTRFVASFAVVLLHVAGGVVDNAALGSFNWWVGNFVDSFVRWCVPVFIILTGYLLSDPNKQIPTYDFYKKRVSRILIPITVWIIFYSMVTYLLSGSKGSVLSLIENFATGKPYYHMWYFYLLVGLYLVAPFVNRLILNLSDKELILIIILSSLLSSIDMTWDHFLNRTNSWPMTWFLSFLPFYFVGNLLHRTGVAEKMYVLNLPVFLCSFTIVFVGFFVLAKSIGQSEATIMYSYLSIPVGLMAITVFLALRSGKLSFFSPLVITHYAKLSFGIYLIHPFFLTLSDYFGFSNFSDNAVIYIFVTTVITYVVSGLSVRILLQVPFFRRTV